MRGRGRGARAKDELCELYREAVRIERESLVAEDVESDYFNNKILWHIVISLAAIAFVANIAPHLATPFGALLVSAAVLFGFSERMFTGIAEALENKMLPEGAGKAKRGEGVEDTSTAMSTITQLETDPLHQDYQRLTAA